MIPILHGGKWGLINLQGSEVLPCVYEQVLVPSFGIIVVRKSEGWGAVDFSGRWLIPPSLAFLSEFDASNCAVYQAGGQYGIIHMSGKVVIAASFDQLWPSINGVYVGERNGEKVLFTLNGKLTLTIKTSWLSFSGDWHRIGVLDEKSEKFGFIDINKSWCLPPVYDSIDAFSEGYALVEQNQKKGYIIRSGDWIAPKSGNSFRAFSEGLAAFCEGDKWGYLSLPTVTAIPPVFNEVGHFCCGLATARQEQLFGYILGNGQWAIQCKFSEAGAFYSQGFAYVATDQTYGVLVPSGSLLWERPLDEKNVKGVVNEWH